MKSRLPIVALTLSAAAFIGLVMEEGYTSKAVIPTKGDVPTVGFGSTYRPDGSRVTMQDAVDPPRALTWALVHIGKDEGKIKSCITAPLYQGEYDVMVNFAYQYGADTLCKSSIVKRANAGDYVGSCKAYLLYKFSAGYDCSTPGNRICYGVWARQLKRYNDCMEVQ